MSVYLIHFDRPFGHALHYVGYSKAADPSARIEHHRRGTGANLLRHVNAAGIGWEVVRVWPDGDRALERKLKRGSSKVRHCPRCRASLLARCRSQQAERRRAVALT